MYQNAVMYLDAYTNVTITHSMASHTGGGICVDTDYLESKPVCFFQLADIPHRKQLLIETINITVYNNFAGYAGHNIFGGSIDYCYIIAQTITQQYIAVQKCMMHCSLYQTTQCVFHLLHHLLVMSAYAIT